MYAQPNPPCGLTDHGAVLEGFIYTLNRVVLHADEETRAQLGMGSTGIEKSG